MITRDDIQLGADLAVVLALVFSGVALYLNVGAFKAQKRSQQASLFNELVGRIHSVLDQQKTYEKEKEITHWYVTLFDAFEYYAFFANCGHLSPEMLEYCKSSIVEYYGYANKDNDVREYLSSRPKGQLNELRKYYKTVTYNDPPF